MNKTYDERLAKLAVSSRIIEEIDLALSNVTRTIRDIKDTNFKNIIVASQTTTTLEGAILAGGFTYTTAAAAMGASISVLGIGSGLSLLGLLGLPILGPFAILGLARYMYKKKKEREKNERLEKDLLNAEKLALQKVIKKQIEVIQALKNAMEELGRKQEEVEYNATKTVDYVKQQEERVEYLERLLSMVNMAGEAFLEGAA